MPVGVVKFHQRVVGLCQVCQRGVLGERREVIRSNAPPRIIAGHGNSIGEKSGKEEKGVR